MRLNSQPSSHRHEIQEIPTNLNNHILAQSQCFLCPLGGSDKDVKLDVEIFYADADYRGII